MWRIQDFTIDHLRVTRITLPAALTVRRSPRSFMSPGAASPTTRPRAIIRLQLCCRSLRACSTPRLEELLGSETPKRKARASLSPRLERRLKLIEGLSPKPKQQLLSIIDTFIGKNAALRETVSGKAGAIHRCCVRAPRAMWDT